MDFNKLSNIIVENIKDIFNLGPKNIVGIDLGLSAVKIAEVSKVGEDKYKLVKYASIELPEGAFIEDEIQKDEEVTYAIKEALEQAKISNGLGCIGLSGPSTVARKLQLAGGTIEEIEDQVTWEAEQYLPFAIEESSVAFHVFGENEGGGVDVLVAAAKNNLINDYKRLFDGTGLNIKIVDLNLLSLVNVFEVVERDSAEEPDSSWILIDFGAQKTEFVIYKNETIVFTKEMSIGGVIITEEIQRQMGVNYSDAENLKIVGDDNGNLPEEIIEIIDDVIEAFFAEIKKTIDFYLTQTSDENLKGCFITGGGGYINKLMDGLESSLGVEVKILDPFKKITYDSKKFNDSMIESIRHRGLVALGLAMRTLQK